MAALVTTIRPNLNLALLGAPGSGKGSYGKLLSKTLRLPLVTVSNVLRQQQQQQQQQQQYCADEARAHMSSGKLLRDETVCQILQNYLMDITTAHDTNGGYILDGFPRTLRQIHLMQDSWPREIQVEGAIALNVPNQVCKEKIMGRRYCSKCGNHFNTADVLHGDFDLPAQLPTHPNCIVFEEAGGSRTSRIHLTCEKEHWRTRPDDACPNIVQERLEIHEDNTTPILEYFAKHRHLLTFIPNKGYDDMPRFERVIDEWLKGIESP